MSRLELGSPRKVDKQLVNIPSVLDETLELVVPEVEEKEIKVKKNYESKYLVVVADKEKLLRVFLNIVDIRYMSISFIFFGICLCYLFIYINCLLIFFLLN